MPITVQSATATPSTIGIGQQSDLAAVLLDPDSTTQVEISADGSSVVVSVLRHEAAQYSVDATQKGQPGMVVAKILSGPGSLAVGQNGHFILT